MGNEHHCRNRHPDHRYVGDAASVTRQPMSTTNMICHCASPEPALIEHGLRSICEKCGQYISEAPARANSMNAWNDTLVEVPPRSVPVLCAWPHGTGQWYYNVAKFTGKRWLEVILETDNGEFVPPARWQLITPPSR